MTKDKAVLHAQKVANYYRKSMVVVFDGKEYFVARKYKWDNKETMDSDLLLVTYELVQVIEPIEHE